jgi:hypothetical protein
MVHTDSVISIHPTRSWRLPNEDAHQLRAPRVRQQAAGTSPVSAHEPLDVVQRVLSAAPDLRILSELTQQRFDAVQVEHPVNASQVAKAGGSNTAYFGIGSSKQS